MLRLPLRIGRCSLKWEVAIALGSWRALGGTKERIRGCAGTRREGLGRAPCGGAARFAQLGGSFWRGGAGSGPVNRRLIRNGLDRLGLAAGEGGRPGKKRKKKKSEKNRIKNKKGHRNRDFVKIDSQRICASNRRPSENRPRGGYSKRRESTAIGESLIWKERVASTY